MQLKRFLVFSGYQYYPQQAWEDFKTSCDTREEAIVLGSHQLTLGNDWYQIVDTETGQYW